MARKTRRTHAQGEASRRAILEATVRLAGERGYVGTTMNRIVKASGLPASSVYWHFNSKDELLADALEYDFARWFAAEPRWVAEDARPTAARIFHELRLATEQLADGGFWRMGLLLALETGPAVGSAPRLRFLGIRKDALAVLRTWWEAALASDGNQDDGVAASMAMLTGAALDGAFAAQLSQRAQDHEELLWLLAHGLEAAARHLTEKGATRPAAVPRPGWPAPAVDDSARGKFLRAAAEVAAESGYEGATISQITKRTGLPASSLYWLFKDKDDLLGAVVESSYQEWNLREPIWLPVTAGNHWADDLRTHLAMSVHNLRDYPTFLQIGFLLLLPRREDPPSGRATFLALRRRVQLILADWFQSLIRAEGTAHTTPEQLAKAVMVLTDGLFFSDRLDTPSWDVNLFADLAAAVVEGAVGAAAIT